MTATLPDGSFETGAGWTFTGTAGIQAGYRPMGHDIYYPTDGAHMAYLEAWTGAGVTAGSSAQTLTVDPADAGYYGLSGTMAAGEDSTFDPDPTYGPIYIDIFLDDVLWQGSVVIPLATVNTWSVLGLAPVYWASGLHTLHIVAHSPHKDILGSDYPSWFQQVVLLDNLALVPAPSGVVLPGTRGPKVRLAHVSGRGLWETDGETTEQWAGGVKRETLPYPTMTPPAEFVLGKDPTTGLGMWVDPPAATSSIPIPPVTVPPTTPPVTVPAPGDACVQTRCGASVALQTKLVHDYQNWQHWINAAVGFAVGGLIASVLAELAAILAVAEVAAWVVQVLKLATPIISTSSVSVLPSLIPNLSAPQVDAILHAFFCQVQCTGGEVAFNVTDQQAVSAAILADSTTYPSDLMRELLGEIVYYDPIMDWQAAMTNAPVSGLCDGMSCP